MKYFPLQGYLLVWLACVVWKCTTFLPLPGSPWVSFSHLDLSSHYSHSTFRSVSYSSSIFVFSCSSLQKSLTILGSSFYGGAILLGTTDYFLQDSLLLDWVWERVKVDRIIDNNIDIMVTKWNLNSLVVYPHILGHNSQMLDGLDSVGNMASNILHW